MEKTKKFTIDLSEEEREKLRVLAFESKQSAGQVLRDLINEAHQRRGEPPTGYYGNTALRNLCEAVQKDIALRAAAPAELIDG